MNSNQQAILRSARIAELRNVTSSVAALCKPPAAVKLIASHDRRDGRWLLFQLLARERQRSAKLAEELAR
jgi:hypothetical protein